LTGWNASLFSHELNPTGFFNKDFRFATLHSSSPNKLGDNGNLKFGWLSIYNLKKEIFYNNIIKNKNIGKIHFNINTILDYFLINLNNFIFT
jgi:hypothetical protein